LPYEGIIEDLDDIHKNSAFMTIQSCLRIPNSATYSNYRIFDLLSISCRKIFRKWFEASFFTLKVLKRTVFLVEMFIYAIGVQKMDESEDKLYKIIELVGSSPNGWEDAVNVAVAEAGKTLRDLRIVEVDKLDAKIIDGKIVSYRAKVKLSFRYHPK
jgi:hypothetical protein